MRLRVFEDEFPSDMGQLRNIRCQAQPFEADTVIPLEMMDLMGCRNPLLLPGCDLSKDYSLAVQPFEG